MHRFLRMAIWVRRPPSARRVLLVLGAIGLCVALFAIERWIGWPEALTLEPVWRAPTMR